jgi:hypothetical protein
MRKSGSQLDDGANQNRDMAALRDHFATIALTQIIVSNPHETSERKALEAYQIADSMMRQRERSASGLG